MMDMEGWRDGGRRGILGGDGSRFALVGQYSERERETYMACQPGSSGGSARQIFSLFFLKGLPAGLLLRSSGGCCARDFLRRLPKAFFGGCAGLV
jgi:hypothetical protein